MWIHRTGIARRAIGVALLGAALGCAGQPKGEARPPGVIAPGATVLFQGDSITDAGRDRALEAEPNHGPALGRGYAAFAASALLTDPALEGVEVYNRGISGNKVVQLDARWDDDAIALRPDVVSVLIGVNDIWHTLSGNFDWSVERYAEEYDALLARTRAELPDATLVVCEPFVLRCGAVDDSWFPEFDGYRAAARRVADEHGALFVPFHSMFEDALDVAPPEHWAGDGVHPSAEGAALMAETWLRVVRHGG